MAARIKENAILKSAGIETKEFLKPNNCKVVKFVNISQRITLLKVHVLEPMILFIRPYH